MTENAGPDAADVLQQALVGLAGGLLGALAMNVFARAVASAGSGREAEGAAPGVDRSGRGVQPPQADGSAEEDAAVRAGSLAYEATTGRSPDPEVQPWLGTAAHYAFGATAGVFYALTADRLPFVRAGYGTLYGSVIWAVADEGVTPALGLSRGPRELSAGMHVYALAGHLVFGASLETTRRLLATRRTRRVDRRRSRQR